jgi:hypothetical protein
MKTRTLKLMLVTLCLLPCALFAIEIPQDTAFSCGGGYCGPVPPPRDTLAIVNSLVDTVTIDSIYLRQLAATVCPQIASDYSMNPPWGYFGYGTLHQDSVTVDKPMSPTWAIKIPPGAVFVTHFVVGSCLWCVSVNGEQYADQCVIMATFFPSKGARDSVVLVGPRISGGTKYGVRASKSSALPNAGVTVFDCHGRLISSVRRTGIYLITNGKNASLRFLSPMHQDRYIDLSK